MFHCGWVTESEDEASPSMSKQQQSSTAGTEKVTITEDGQLRLLGETYMYADCNSFYGSNYVLGLFVVSLVFFVFTITMGCEQIEAIETGKSKIARMKMSVGSSGTEFSRVSEGFNEMFGGTSPQMAWHWFIPKQVEFPRGMKKVVLGFEWDESLHSPYQEDSCNVIGNGDSNDDEDGDHELQALEAGGLTPLDPSSVAATVSSLSTPATAPPPPPSSGLRSRSSSELSLGNSSHNGVVKNRRTKDRPSLAGDEEPRLKGTMV